MVPLAATLVVYSLQVAILVAVAAAASAVLRLTVPSARLAYWRGVGAACLVLPLLASLRPEHPAASVVFTLFPAASVTGAARSASSLPGIVAPMLVWIYAGGVLARFAWLAAGAMRLRHIRARSVPAILEPELDALRVAIAPRAEFRSTLDIGQPVTCGLRRPVILLPSRFARLGPDAQGAVACHELLHVSRRDWAWIVVEEYVRALFWFHPAAWWVLEQVQLSREQLIDRAVVTRTSAKRAYMEALLAFAETGRVASPSTAFLRRRHLRSRLQLLSKEPQMSRQRLICSLTVLTLVTGAAAVSVAAALPLVPPAPPAGENGASPQEKSRTTLPVPTRKVNPSYTAAAMDAKIEGEVLLEVLVEADGSVGNVSITRSLDAVHGLDDAAVDAARQWEFRPGSRDGKPVAVTVTLEMRFTLRN